MSQIYKVFSNNLVFCVKEGDVSRNISDYIIIDKIEDFIELMQQSVCRGFSNKFIYDTIIFYSKKIKTDWLKIIKSFEIIEASGGVVRRDNNDLLFILKNDKWDLPKGKIDYGEDKKQAAIREIKEETGLLNLEIKDFLLETYHLFYDKSIILKKTFWFLVYTNCSYKLIPQKEEGITDLRWFSIKNLPETYNSINDVIIELND